jgi:hypothetical protein
LRVNVRASRHRPGAGAARTFASQHNRHCAHCPQSSAAFIDARFGAGSSTGSGASCGARGAPLSRRCGSVPGLAARAREPAALQRP